ncbi:BtpA/SgcQ family protein [Cyanobium sp. ATX-6F1]|uniref:BtpA/SgcQ family protein n=1 Tax=Cyanobium sp. ATX-6F1 TaxID=3137388 RepID=UPI0039BE8E31
MPCPLIGVVHLQPLPGSPLWAGDLEAVQAAALADARAYLEGGADGLIVENFGDAPFWGSGCRRKRWPRWPGSPPPWWGPHPCPWVSTCCATMPWRPWRSPRPAVPASSA